MIGGDWLVAIFAALAGMMAFGLMIFVAIDGDIPAYDGPYEDPLPFAPPPGICNACWLHSHAHCEKPLNCICRICRPTRRER